MHITQLNISNVRNLLGTSLLPCKNGNFIFGENGSGKSSLLESIFLISRGKSFRARDIRTVISESATDCIVYSTIQNCEEMPNSIGVKRCVKGSLEAKCDGIRIKSSAELSALVPLQLVDSNSFDLVDGSPSARRKFLDWGVFHVEHLYSEAWSSFQKALKQRNYALKYESGANLTVWNNELSRLNKIVTDFRETYLLDFVSFLQSAFNRYEPLKDIEIEYNRGWAEDEAFEDILIRSEATDRLQGYTSSGAHKADLSIGIGKIKARDKLSRGQTKLLVYALKLAQGELFKKLTGKKCIYILDDLPSELDEINKTLVFEHLADLDCQFFVTGVDKSDFLSHLPKKTCKMFHVEQGNITECNY